MTVLEVKLRIIACESMNIVWISKISMDMPHKTSRLKMSEALRRRGHNVTLYMVKKFGEKNFTSPNIVLIPTINLPILSGLFFGLIVFFGFPVVLSRKKIDVIIIDCTKVWLPFVVPLKMLNMPIILDIRTLPIDSEKSFFFSVSLYLSRFIVNGVTTITPELNKILRDVYNLKNKEVGVWSSGVSIEDFNKIDINQHTVREVRNGGFTLIYHGDYSPTRGIEDLIKAIGKLNPPLKDKVRLLIIGMPTNKIKDLLKLSEEEGVKEQVKILPKIEYNKITQYLKISDVGVVPLPPENRWWQVSAPLKTLECLAAGKPVIATKIPFHRKIFEKGNCGILIESSKPEVIAKAITFLYKNQEELKEMGIEGRKIVEKFYTWDCMAQEVEEFLKTFNSGILI
ncbi:MAG: glycosyltransferase family 4 protein [Atribacterota bacterium]